MNTVSTDEKTIKDLILEAVQAGPIGNGHEAKVYRLPLSAAGGEPYVVRIKHAFTDPIKLKARLKASTALTPPDRVVKGIHVGQPFLTLDGSDDISILPAQKGTSISKLWERYCETLAATLSPQTFATTLLMEKLIALQKKPDDNPFIPLFEQGYDIGYSGKLVDFKPANILLDEQSKTLHLVDQSMPIEQTGLPFPLYLLHPETSATDQLRDQPERFLGYFSELLPEGVTPALARRHDTAYNKVSRMMEAAAEQVIRAHEHNPNKLKSMRHAHTPKGLAFAAVSDVKAVALDAPPKTLLESLREIENRAAIPGREHLRG